MPATSKSAPARYFVSAPVDFALIGGLSILAFLGLRYLHGEAPSPMLLSLSALGLWVCNWPHFAATSYRLYHSRENIRQYPMTALVIPWVILAVMLAALAFPTSVAPFFVKVFLIWSPYHFSAQSVGITLIYARRNGFRVGRWERLALSAFIFGTFVSQTLRSEIASESYGSFFGIHTPHLGLPAWTLTATTAVMWIAGAVFLGLVLRWSLAQRRMLPGMVLLPAVTQYVWFVQGAGHGSYQELVPLFHALQYLFIAWCMQLKEKMDLRGIAPSPRYVLAESARWGAVIFAVGAALFYGLPRLVTAAVPLPGPDPLLFATGVVFAAVQIHHFFVDGVIWKLRRKTVASPLMINIEELVRPAARAPATAHRSAA